MWTESSSVADGSPSCHCRPSRSCSMRLATESEQRWSPRCWGADARAQDSIRFGAAGPARTSPCLRSQPQPSSPSAPCCVPPGNGHHPDGLPAPSPARPRTPGTRGRRPWQPDRHRRGITGVGSPALDGLPPAIAKPYGVPPSQTSTTPNLLVGEPRSRMTGPR